MTDHTHVRAAAMHYMGPDTCVHRLLPPDLSTGETEPRKPKQCDRQPCFVVGTMPSCDQHVAAVLTWNHDNRTPDVVVRRWL